MLYLQNLIRSAKFKEHKQYSAGVQDGVCLLSQVDGESI